MVWWSWWSCNSNRFWLSVSMCLTDTHSALILQQNTELDVINDRYTRPIAFVTHMDNHTRPRLPILTFLPYLWSISNFFAFPTSTRLGNTTVSRNFGSGNTDNKSNRWWRVFSVITWGWQFLRGRLMAMKAFCFSQENGSNDDFHRSEGSTYRSSDFRTESSVT